MDTSFVHIGFIEILDFAIVLLLIYQLYRLLKGTVAIYILAGFVLIYFIWLGVEAAGLKLLTAFLGQFVGIGVILLVIIFQPEIRRFLLFLGESAFRNQQWSWAEKVFSKLSPEKEMLFDEKTLSAAIEGLIAKKEGALIVLCPKAIREDSFHSGSYLNAELNSELLISIFQKTSPLHDGAVLIRNGKIKYAGCVLPISKNANLPNNLGLRHRAAVGLSEVEPVLVIVLSEENQELRIAEMGELSEALSLSDLSKKVANASTAKASQTEK